MKTFQERLTDHENKRHANRVAEIVAISDLLAAADPYIKKAEARLDVEIRLDQRLLQFMPASVDMRKALYLGIERYMISDQRLYDVLLSFGFVEIERSNVSGQFDLAHLQLNDLLLAVTCNSSLSAQQRVQELIEFESLQIVASANAPATRDARLLV